MTLTKKTMIREIGRRTRLTNRDVQVMLEMLIEVWTEELVEGSGRIELENFAVIEAHFLQSYARSPNGSSGDLRSTVDRVTIRVSKTIKRQFGR